MSKYLEMAKEFCEKTGTKITITFKEKKFNPWNETNRRYQWVHNIYRVKILRNGKSFSFDFTASADSTQKNIEPNEYDILACLQKYDVGTFEDFCSEFGYNMIDDYTGKYDKKSMKTYKAVVKEYENVTRLFNDCMEDLYEIN